MNAHITEMLREFATGNRLEGRVKQAVPVDTNTTVTLNESKLTPVTRKNRVKTTTNVGNSTAATTTLPSVSSTIASTLLGVAGALLPSGYGANENDNGAPHVFTTTSSPETTTKSLPRSTILYDMHLRGAQKHTKS
jgi:hypothetical protein